MGALRSQTQTDPEDPVLERESLRAEFAELAVSATSAEVLYDSALRILLSGLHAFAGWVMEIELAEKRPRVRVRAECGEAAQLLSGAGEWLTPTLQVVREKTARLFDTPECDAIPEALRRGGAARMMALPLAGRRGEGAALWLACDARKVAGESARMFATSIARVLDAALGRLERERELGRFRQSVDLLPDGVLIMRSDGKLLDANDTAIDYYGYPREELLGLSILDLRAGTTLPEVLWQMRRAGATGLIFETVHRRKDGTQFRCQVRSRGALVNGEHVLISLIRKVESDAVPLG